MGAWIDRASLVPGGIAIPSAGRWQQASLVLTLDSECATLSRGQKQLCLDWESFIVGSQDPTTSGWCFSTVNTETRAGVVVYAFGDVRRDLGRFKGAWSALSRFSIGLDLSENSETADTLVALGLLLRDRPEGRSVFADSRRCAQLLAALQQRALRNPKFVKGAVHSLRRDAVEIDFASKRCGYIHQFGSRPLPGQVMPNAEECVVKLRQSLESGDYSREVEVSDELLHRWVRTRYLVEPWPFEAVLERNVWGEPVDGSAHHEGTEAHDS